MFTKIINSVPRYSIQNQCLENPETSSWFSLNFPTDDPYSVTENPTKFGLAVLTIVFDVLFMCQHYVFYRKSTTEVEYDDDSEEIGSKEAFLKDV